MKRLRTAATAAGLLAALAPPADAHYFVPVGDGSVGFFLGFMVEPVFEGEPNGVEIYPFKDITKYNNGVPLDGRPVGKADEVRISAVVQTLDAPGEAGKVIAERKLGSLRELFTPRRYAREFRPYPAGYYAFHLKGTINGQAIDDTFYCTPGSHATFGCVDPARPPFKVIFPPKSAAGDATD
ncbi:MAG: hypothetical protein U1E83_08750 [Methylotetracoccus sp.]